KMASGMRVYLYESDMDVPLVTGPSACYAKETETSTNFVFVSFQVIGSATKDLAGRGGGKACAGGTSSRQQAPRRCWRACAAAQRPSTTSIATISDQDRRSR